MHAHTHILPLGVDQKNGRLELFKNMHKCVCVYIYIYIYIYICIECHCLIELSVMMETISAFSDTVSSRHIITEWFKYD